ncbi:TPA: hypothetical protein SLP05_003762 [Pseudomonas putida]|nr:hypothetical protein [Pseudomonas putida]
MPTENRPSNTEMVSVPPYIGLEPLVGRYYPAQCRRCGWVGSSEELTEDDAQCTRDVGDRLCLGDCDELERHDLLNIIQAMATPQPHPEPIAWMVGTAIWWTKEEAERDAAAMDLPVVGLGPMTGSASADQHQGEPVGEVVAFGKGLHEIAWAAGRMPKLGAKLYTHADPGEVERLRDENRKLHEAGEFLDGVNQGIEDKLRAQLAEARALLQRAYDADQAARHHLPYNVSKLMDDIESVLSAHAGPNAPNACAICRDLGNQCMECEEGEFREWADRHFAASDYRKTDAGVFIQDWMRHAYAAWCARAALARKA